MLSNAQFYEMGRKNIIQMEKIMLKLREFIHNHHAYAVKCLQKIRDEEFR